MPSVWSLRDVTCTLIRRFFLLGSQLPPSKLCTRVASPRPEWDRRGKKASIGHTVAGFHLNSSGVIQSDRIDASSNVKWSKVLLTSSAFMTALVLRLCEKSCKKNEIKQIVPCGCLHSLECWIIMCPRTFVGPMFAGCLDTSVEVQSSASPDVLIVFSQRYFVKHKYLQCHQCHFAF